LPYTFLCKSNLYIWTTATMICELLFHGMCLYPWQYCPLFIESLHVESACWYDYTHMLHTIVLTSLLIPIIAVNISLCYIYGGECRGHSEEKKEEEDAKTELHKLTQLNRFVTKSLLSLQCRLCTTDIIIISREQ